MALASALAGCLAIDIVHILTKGRFDMRSFSTQLTGRRADNEPRRFVSFDLRFTLDTSAPAEQVDRAIALSREKYCSVWHSLRQDIELTTQRPRHGVRPASDPVRRREGGEQVGTPANRRAYIDWMRGLSVLFMIEAHTFDAWTVLADRGTPLYKAANFIGGLAAPIFLFLAGVSVAMAASSRTRRTGDRAAAAWSVQKRGWQIFGLAFLFRLQSWMLSPGATVKGIFKADILNIMGPSIAAAAWMWGRLADRRARLATFAALACAFAFATPIIRNAAWLAWLPDPIEWYIRPFPKLSVFTFFPWTGFVFAGAFVGEWLDTARTPADEWRANRWLAAAGVALVAAGYGASFLPSLYPAGCSNFWTSSPTYFFVKIGIMLVLMGAIYVYVQRPFSAEPRNPAWSPMLEFGRSSLFVYWIHVELVYGIFSYPIHRKLPVWGSLAAFIAFTLFIYGVTLLKSRLVAGWKARRAVATSRRAGRRQAVGVVWISTPEGDLSCPTA